MTRDLVDMMGGGKGSAPQEPSEAKTEHVELELVLHYDNEARSEILVSLDGEESKAVWLKKEQIQFQPTGKDVAAKTTKGKPVQLPEIIANVPEWLATDKGLT